MWTKPSNPATSVNTPTSAAPPACWIILDAERTYRANQLAYRQALASYMTAVEQMREAVGTRRLP